MSKENAINSHLIISEEKENQNNNINSKEKINEFYLKKNNEIKFTKKYNNEELNIFRDDILQYLKESFQEYSKNLHLYFSKINKTEKNFKEITTNINLNYNKIIESQANMNIQFDKLKDYESFYNKTNDKLISHEIRLNNIREEFSKATQKYDKIYLDNLELPGYIGRCAKYKNCQLFFNDIIKELSCLNQFKEKNILDLKSYKDKLENIIKSFNILVDNNNQSQIKYINALNKKNLSECQGMIDILGERIMELKVENAKYSMDIMNKSDELSKKWEKVEEFKKNILNEFEIKSNDYKKGNENLLNKFNEFKIEYKVIKDKFLELAEFIKDIRFKKNIKNINGENINKRDIKNIYNSLKNMNIDINKKNDNKDKINEKTKELIKYIKNENNLDKSDEIDPLSINEYMQKNKNKFRKSMEYNSPLLFNIKKSVFIPRNEQISMIKNNNTMDYSNEGKKLNLYYNNNNNYNKKEEENKNSIENHSKKKESQKIIIDSNEDKERKEISGKNIQKEKMINNLSASSKNGIIINKNNKSPEDSNSIIADNISTLANNNNNSANDNNISLSSISAFCINGNNNNNKNFICIDTNDKVIKELASELEQSTAKKDEKFKINKNIIEPLNLVKSIQEEKGFVDSSSLRDKNDILFSNSNRYNMTDSNKKIDTNNHLNKLKISTENKNKPNTKNNILYGDNPRAIDKKFIMTDKKLLDLEEYTKAKILEIISQIDKLKNISQNIMKKSKKDNNDISFSTKEKNSFNSYRGILGYTSKSKNEFNNSHKKNIFRGLNSKNNENNINTNFEKNKNAFDLTGYNFHKSKLYNIEQISQKIFNSSCKKIKTCSNLNDIENFHSNKAKDFIKNNILTKNEINKSDREPKKSESIENKKWNINIINKIKNNELKKIKCRNNSSGNIYLTQKKGESLSFNEAEIKLVYLNKFVNGHLPYGPIDGFSGEESFNI